MQPHPQHKNLLQFRILDSVSEISHFSTTRNGGVSRGAFSSLNLGNYSDDSPLKIFENRTILARMFNKREEDFIVPHQTHSTNILLIDNDFAQLDKAAKVDRLYNVDAVITQQKNLFLCITTADCVPILLYDFEAKAIAAVHAGWKSTAGRIVEKTIAMMRENFGTSPQNILAAIGPAIGIENYEVGDEVIEEFSKNGFSFNKKTARKFPPSPKTHLDLKEINRLELIRLGVPKHQIEKTRYCTFENEKLFFSARRQSIHSGRMLSGIMLVG